MFLGDLETEGRELHHAIPTNIHESPEFRGEYERRWVAEIHEAKQAVRTNLAVNHGRDLSSVVLRIEAQCVSCGYIMSKPEANDLENFCRCFPVIVEFAKHCCMKGVMYGRSDLGCNASMSLSVDQQHTGGGIELVQVFSNSLLFRTLGLSVMGDLIRRIFRPGFQPPQVRVDNVSICQAFGK